MSRTRVVRVLAAVLPALLAGACSGIAEPPETLFWEGTLEPGAGGLPDLRGTAAMVASERVTQIGIGIEEGPPGATFGWIVRNGSCNEPREPVGPVSAFPAVVVSDERSGDATTVLQRRLGANVDYAAQIVEDADGTGEVIACADLIQRT